ncbi:MAG: NAD(+) synthase [Thermoleophilaceae bacterium]
MALVAVDALGADRVTCVIMPSTYSTDETQSDARRIAENLGTDVVEIAIEPAMEVYEQLLAEPFADTEPDIAEENLQARIRGNLVMALSNKFGWLVLTTGNKSELSVGYATLYGDMAGGFAVIKDVFKLLVYRLVEWRNEQADRELVPSEVITRPPSAELRHEQRDDQSLPLRGAGRHPGRLRGARPGRRRARGPGLLGGGCGAHHPDGRSRRVQAPPGASGDQGLHQGLRPRPPPADHQPLPHRGAPAPAAAAGTAVVTGASAVPDPAAQDGCARTAIVTRVRRAQAALLVGEVDLPHPARPAPVAAPGLGADRALRDGAQEAGVVGLAHGDLALVLDLAGRWRWRPAPRPSPRRRRRERFRRAGARGR